MNWKDNVLNAHQLNRLPHWKMFRGTSSKVNGVFESVEDDDFEKSHARLKQCLDLISVGGMYLIQFKPEKKINNGLQDYIFEVPLHSFATPAGATPAIGNVALAGFVSKDEVQEKIERERRLWELEQNHREAIGKIGELSQRLKDAEKAASPFAEAFSKLEPYYPLIFGILGKKFNVPGIQAGISGLGSAPVPPVEQGQQLTPEQQQEIEAANGKLREIVEYLGSIKGGQVQGIEFLWKLKNKLQENPQMLPMIESFVNN